MIAENTNEKIRNRNNKILDAVRRKNFNQLRALVKDERINLDRPMQQFDYFKTQKRDARKFSLRDAIKRLQEIPELEKHQILRDLSEGKIG